MRQKQAKFLKAVVLDSVYGDVPKSEKRKIYKDKQFKKIYRARKKNYTRGIMVHKKVEDANKDTI
jgi:hypothetical protein